MTYNDVEYLNALINAISVDQQGQERDLGIKIKVKFLKIAAAIESEVSAISKLKNGLYQKYGETLEDGQTIQVKEENKDAFFKDLKDLYDTPSDVEIAAKFDEDTFIDTCEKLKINLSFKDIQFLQNTLFETV
jgi:hypothetical protein